MNNPRDSFDGPIAHQSGRGVAQFRRRLMLIICLGLLCRIALLLYVEQRPRRFDFPDSHRYIRVARNIAAGRGPIESETIRAATDPLYPAMLSVPILLGAESEEAIMRSGRIINIAFALMSIAILASLTRRLLTDRSALIAATILALDPILLYFNALVLTESCYITLLLGAVYCLVRFGTFPSQREVEDPTLALPLSRGGNTRKLSMGWLIGAGLGMGLGILLRSSSLFLPLLLVPFVWHSVRRLSNGSRSFNTSTVLASAIFLLSSVVVLIPTIICNHHQFDRIVLVRTGGGASLLEALGPWADGSPGMDRIVYPPTPPKANEVERDEIYKRAAWTWARDNPTAVLKLAWTKLLRTWSVTIQAPGYQNSAYAAICWATVAPEFVLALYGLWLLRRRRWLLFLVLAPASYYTLVHMVYVGSVRYRVPAMPLIFVLVGVAISHLRFQFGRRQSI